MRRQSGYSLIELSIVVVILTIIGLIVTSIVSDYTHRLRIDRSASDFSLVATAVQRRNAHDSFLFSFWDENGSNVATNATLSWEEGDEFEDLLNQYLVGRDNGQCGQGANGWNPLNTEGQPDMGAPTLMEKAALVPCNKLRGQLPWRLKASAAISPDTTGSVGTFALYLNPEDAYFDTKDNPGNNILNLALLRNSLENKLTDGVNGVPRVNFTTINNLNDISDDGVPAGTGDNRPLTSTECEDDIANCVIAVYIDFTGIANGLYKRKDNQDYMLDDLTFGSSVAAGRQRCSFWEQDVATGAWSNTLVDCGIKGGSGDSQVTLIVDEAHTKDLRITNEVGVTSLCRVFMAEDRAAGRMALRSSPAPGDVTPCGFTKNGNIVQMMSDEAHIGIVYGEEIVADAIFASQTTLYSNVNGQVMLTVRNSSDTGFTFRVDNNGNTINEGTLTVGELATFEKDAVVGNDLTVARNGRFLMGSGGAIQMGVVTEDSSLTFSRNGAGTFSITSTGVDLKMLAEDRLSLGAPGGVVTEQGSTLHASRSSLRNDWFNAAGINSDALKSLSEVVTADMAKYLDDTSSPIQVVGIDRIEGEFATLTKPNCLAFAADSNYSSPAANPYRAAIDSGDINPSNGQALARLVLIPIFMKTYNAAFGDNQIYSQHGVHSSPQTWDIYLYLSGEGAFGTGGREDGAGASLAMSVCDYSSLNISRQDF